MQAVSPFSVSRLIGDGPVLTAGLLPFKPLAERLCLMRCTGPASPLSTPSTKVLIELVPMLTESQANGAEQPVDQLFRQINAFGELSIGRRHERRARLKRRGRVCGGVLTGACESTDQPFQSAARPESARRRCRPRRHAALISITSCDNRASAASAGHAAASAKLFVLDVAV